MAESKTIEELEIALARAQQALAELDRTQAKTPAHTLPGGKNGEAAAQMRYARQAAQLAILRIEANCLDAMEGNYQAEFDALRNDIAQAEQQLKLAKEALVTAHNKAARFEQRTKANRDRRNQLSIRIADLVYRQANSNLYTVTNHQGNVTA